MPVKQKSSPSLYPSWDACVLHTARWLATPSLGSLRHAARGTLLYSQGESHASFYLIREGFVQSDMVHDNGKRLMLELMGPGTMFGEGAAFDGLPRFVDARCVTDAVLSVYTPQDLQRAGPDSVELFAALVRIMSSKQRALAGKLLQFTGGDPQMRLRQLLARVVAVQQRAQAHAAPVQSVRFSQEQLAEMCGMSRISAARVLKRLADEGVVRTHVKYVEVLQPTLL